MHSFLDLLGIVSAILSHRSLPNAVGKVFIACSNNFCSSGLQGLGACFSFGLVVSLLSLSVRGEFSYDYMN